MPATSKIVGGPSSQWRQMRNGIAERRRLSGGFDMTNDTLALSFTDPPVTDDRVNGPEEPEKKSCPLTLSPRDGTHGAQALTVSEARDEHEQPPGFNYAEVPEIGDQLRETAARVRKRMGVYLIRDGSRPSVLARSAEEGPIPPLD